MNQSESAEALRPTVSISIDSAGRVNLTENLLDAIRETAIDFACDPGCATLWRTAYNHLAAASDHLVLMKRRAEFRGFPVEPSPSEPA